VEAKNNWSESRIVIGNGTWQGGKRMIGFDKSALYICMEIPHWTPLIYMHNKYILIQYFEL
jgi:hypothetical protein